MIKWELALKSLDIDEDGFLRSAGGAGEYEDPDFGEIEFLWRVNKTHVFLSFTDTNPICLCGRGFMDVDCDCEWIGFDESNWIDKKFTKKQYLDLK